MQDNTYIYSQLTCNSVCDIVASHYELGKADACRFYSRGLHDNYLLDSGGEKYILRIYRNNWRSSNEIGFELDLLTYLGKLGAPVAFPIPTKAGELSCRIDAPEGSRSVALFHYARGHAPGNGVTPAESELLGSAVARIHRLSADFKTRHSRPLLELPYLVDQALAAIAPFVDGNMQAFLESIQAKLHDTVPAMASDGDTCGICIGDVNLSNFHVSQGDITVFDFDQCGYGVRAFEIGKFNSSVHMLKNREEIAEAFCRGYQQVRQLSNAEIAAIPYFELVAMIWVMGINASNADLIGHKWLEQSFWDRKKAALTEMKKKLWPE